MINKFVAYKVPGYIKYFFILSSIILTLCVAIVAQFLVKPLFSALIIALLLKPLSSRLENLTHSRVLGITLTVSAILAMISLLFLFIFSQAQNIANDIDKLSQGFSVVLDNIQRWLQSVFGFAPEKQISLLKKHASRLVEKFTAFLPDFLVATADFFAEFILFVIALCFFLYYRQFLVNFLFRLSGVSRRRQVITILNAVQVVIKKYILGVFLVVVITGTLNTIGLLILGIKHAVFFGVVAGILTIIPYIGIIAGSLLPILFTIATTSSAWYPLGVILVFSSVQFLEGNFITPKIVGTQVSLNSLASLLALFFSGKFFGILGVILALPCLAIMKVIADRIDTLKPYGYLIGTPKKKSKSH